MSKVKEMVTITKVEIPISYGVPVTMLVPEYLLGAEPLAIRLKGDGKRIQIWAWGKTPPVLVSAKFVMVEDDNTYTLKKGTRLNRHFGTVWDSDGKAIHLLSLYDVEV